MPQVAAASAAVHGHHHAIHHHKHRSKFASTKVLLAVPATELPDRPKPEAIVASMPVHLRCCGGVNDWQPRWLITTANFVALTLPEEGAPVRDAIYFASMDRCEFFDNEDSLSFLTWPDSMVMQAIHEDDDHGEDLKHDEKAATNGPCSVAICTSKESSNLGRVYLLHFQSHRACRSWKEAANRQIKVCEKQADATKGLFYQGTKKLGHFYHSALVQNIFALIILANFLVSICEAMMDIPKDPAYTKTVLGMEFGSSALFGFWFADVAFTAFFSAELACNMLCTSFAPFWPDGWNVFG